MRTHSLWLTIFLAASVALVQSLSYSESRSFLRPGDREDMHAHAGLMTFKRWHRAAEVAGG